MTTKEKFLMEHNKLSPKNLQATLAMLDTFKEEKKPLLKNSQWSIDKLRIPFIHWILALPKNQPDKAEPEATPKNSPFHIYPKED